MRHTAPDTGSTEPGLDVDGTLETLESAVADEREEIDAAEVDEGDVGLARVMTDDVPPASSLSQHRCVPTFYKQYTV